ncbi:hypothetical protein Avbf_11766, partial [Armadillidium vulgare]
IFHCTILPDFIYFIYGSWHINMCWFCQELIALEEDVDSFQEAELDTFPVDSFQETNIDTFKVDSFQDNKLDTFGSI